MRFLPLVPLLGAFASSVLAAPPAKFDCTIRYWNDAFRKERAHDYDYSITKVAPSDIAWLRADVNLVGRPGKVGPWTIGFVVLGSCRKGNIGTDTELRNVMMKLSKLASDHGANAISYQKFGTEIRFHFLRIQDAILDAAKRTNKTIAHGK